MNTSSVIREQPSVSIDSQLRPGERVLWLGRPQGSLLTRDDIFLIPFSLVWLGGVIFWEATVIRGGTFFFALFGLPFVAIGLLVAVGRFWFKASFSCSKNTASSKDQINSRSRTQEFSYGGAECLTNFE